MSVMEEGPEADRFLRRNGFHHLRLVPFVNDDQVGARKSALEKSRETLVPLVEVDIELRIGAVKISMERIRLSLLASGC